MDSELIDCLPFQCIADDEFLSIFYEGPLRFETCCNKNFNPFTEPDEHNRSYYPEVNFDQLLSYNLERDFYFLYDISNI